MSTSLSRAWQRRCVWIAAAIVAVIVIWWPTYADMVRVWYTSSTFNHCFLIAPISAYLAWTKRRLVSGEPPAASALGLAFVAVNVVLNIAGNLVGISFLQHLSAVGVIVGSIWALIGTRAAYALLFPIAYLYFSVPEGEFLVPHLQDWTTRVVVAMLRWSGMPVFVEGRNLSIPSGDFTVAEACSGINYLLATFAVGSVYCYLGFRSALRRIAFMLLAVIVPLLANGVRAYGIVMIAHYSGYKYALGVDHFIYGGVFFGIVILALFGLGNLFSDAHDGEDAPAPSAASSAPEPRLHAAIVLLLVALGRASIAALTFTAAGDSAVSLPTSDSWQMTTTPSVLGGEYPGAGQMLVASYRRNPDKPPVVLELAYFPEQHKGAELAGAGNQVFNPMRWQRVAERDFVLEGQALHESVLRSGEQRLLVWSWYEIDGRIATSRTGAKLLTAWARLTRSGHGAAAFAIATSTGADHEAAVARLSDYLRDMKPALLRLRTAVR